MEGSEGNGRTRSREEGRTGRVVGPAKMTRRNEGVGLSRRARATSRRGTICEAARRMSPSASLVAVLPVDELSEDVVGELRVAEEAFQLPHLAASTSCPSLARACARAFLTSCCSALTSSSRKYMSSRAWPWSCMRPGIRGARGRVDHGGEAAARGGDDETMTRRGGAGER